MNRSPVRKAGVTISKILPWPIIRFVILIQGMLILAFAAQMARADIGAFVGSFTGSSEMQRTDGSNEMRGLSVRISENRKSFNVEWTTIAYKSDGRTKETSYDIEFIDSDRAGVIAAAQKKNVFGHEVQLDPMKGEPYVWARIVENTLTVYSLFVADDGGYEIQQFDRTLAEGGLYLEFHRLRNGVEQAKISAFLKRE